MNLVAILVSISSLLGSLAPPDEPAAPLRPLRKGGGATSAPKQVRAKNDEPSPMPMAEPDEPPRVEATVGKGGRDLTARFRVEGRSWGEPAGTLEIYGDLGEKSHLIGFSAQYYRFQPALVAGIKPVPNVELFTGVGVGPTEVRHGVCSDSFLTPCLDLRAEDVLVASTTAQLGTRVEWSGPPVYAVMRLDAIAQHGWSSVVALAFETNH